MILLGTYHERVFATGTDRFSLCILLRPYLGHTVRGHVVPSFRHHSPHPGVYRTQLVLHQEGKGSYNLLLQFFHHVQFQTEEMSPNALLDKQAIEIVKELQKLQGIDGDYDNDSGSGPDRIGRRKTIQNLEKAAQKKRQIGTLDVAFKKRFAKLNANPEAGTKKYTTIVFYKSGIRITHVNNDLLLPGTPLLSRRMTMRKETMKALEVRVNSVMAERRKSHMQTLGAKNDFGNNNIVPRNHRSSVASSIPAKEVFENGQVNQAFEEDNYGTRNSLPLHTRGNVTWKGSNSRM